MRAPLKGIPYGGLAAVLAFLLALSARQRAMAGAATVAALAMLALYFRRHPCFNIIAFTFWVFTMTRWALWFLDHSTA